jgi:hypothetical protein
MPPQPMVSTASLGVGSPPPSKVAGLAIIRFTTIDRTELSWIASVEVDV